MLEAYAGRDKVIGTRQVLRLIAENKIERVFLAEDCDDSIRDQVQSVCKGGGVDISEGCTMRQLQEFCGIDVKTAAIGIKKPGV